MRKYLTIVALMAAFSGMAQLVTVGGVASKEVAPDQAILSFQINGEAKSAEAANEIAENKIKLIQGVLKSKKLPDTLLQVSHANIHFSRGYNNRPDAFNASYSAVIVLPADSKHVTAFIEQIQAGADVSLSLSFGLSTELRSDVEEQLLAAAVRDAQKKAEIIASAINKKVYQVKSISYNASIPSPSPRYAMKAEATMARMDGVEFAIAGNTLSESVTVIFELE